MDKARFGARISGSRTQKSARRTFGGRLLMDYRSLGLVVIAGFCVEPLVAANGPVMRKVSLGSATLTISTSDNWKVNSPPPPIGPTR